MSDGVDGGTRGILRERLGTLIIAAVITAVVTIGFAWILSIFAGRDEDRREQHIESLLVELVEYRDTRETHDLKLEEILDVVCSFAAEVQDPIPHECVGA